MREVGVPPSLLVIGGIFIAGFLFLAAGTVIAVVQDTTPVPPDLSLLAMPAGIEVVDTRETCHSENGCDGYDLLVDHPDANGRGAHDLVVAALHTAGWAGDGPCGSGTCLRHGDLRTHIRLWAEVDRDVTPMLHAEVESSSRDPDQLVYIRFYRVSD